MSIMTEVTTAFVSSGHNGHMVPRQSNPGILVFSRSLQLQYLNRRAIELTRPIGQAMAESVSMVLPIQLLEFRAHVQECLDDRLRANIREPFEVSRVMSECGRRLLLRGFGHPDEAASRDSRIIIVLEEIRSAEKDKGRQLNARMTAPERPTAGAGYVQIHKSRERVGVPDAG